MSGEGEVEEVDGEEVYADDEEVEEVEVPHRSLYGFRRNQSDRHSTSAFFSDY